MFDFSKCHPIELDDLVRVGNDFDGGYILSKRMIDKTKIVLSFGVRDDFTFEEDFSQMANVKIYSYDYSTTLLPFVSKSTFEICVAILTEGLLKFKRSVVLNYLRILRKSKKFYQFYKNKKGKYFVPKFIERYDDEKNTCFETIFKELGEVEDLSVFLKMDIEGGEYVCLSPHLMPYFDKINGMAIEFHNLEINAIKCEELLNIFSSKFYVAHTHGCNFSELICKTNIPSVLEMTFINKIIAPEDIKLSEKEYPIKGLDSPCKKTVEDYILKFTQ
jgi:hypothetical protein